VPVASKRQDPRSVPGWAVPGAAAAPAAAPTTVAPTATALTTTASQPRRRRGPSTRVLIRTPHRGECRPCPERPALLTMTAQLLIATGGLPIGTQTAPYGRHR